MAFQPPWQLLARCWGVLKRIGHGNTEIHGIILCSVASHLPWQLLARCWGVLKRISHGNTEIHRIILCSVASHLPWQLFSTVLGAYLKGLATETQKYKELFMFRGFPSSVAIVSTVLGRIEKD